MDEQDTKRLLFMYEQQTKQQLMVIEEARKRLIEFQIEIEQLNKELKQKQPKHTKNQKVTFNEDL